jgi:hypothetical protein
VAEKNFFQANCPTISIFFENRGAAGENAGRQQENAG